MKRIAIVGIGGIGGFVGSKLTLMAENNPDYEICFIQRGEHLIEIKKNGLRYITKNEYIATPAIVTDTPESAGKFDLVIFCVKSKDLEASAKICLPSITEDTVVLPLLNGVSNAERLGDVVPFAHLLNGCIYVSAGIKQPGVVAQIGGAGFLHFGAPDGDNSRYEWIQEMFSVAGIKSNISSKIEYEVWKKFLFVSPLATVTSFFQEPIGYVAENKPAKRLWCSLLEELLLVAHAKNISLSHQDMDAAIERTSVIPYGTKTSMQVDFEHKRKTELDVFTGFVCQCARENMLLTPAYNSMYKKLVAMQDAYL